MHTLRTCTPASSKENGCVVFEIYKKSQYYKNYCYEINILKVLFIFAKKSNRT